MSDTDTTTKGTNPASILGGLKARREEILAEQHKDLPVPRWTDPEVFVRFRPVEHEVIRRGQVAVDKAPARDRARREVEVNADLLIKACDGVYAVIDGREYSLREGDHEGEWTRFDPDLAAALGLPDPERATARDVVKALYLADGDILSTSGEIVRFSGYATDAANERVAGE